MPPGPLGKSDIKEGGTFMQNVPRYFHMSDMCGQATVIRYSHQEVRRAMGITEDCLHSTARDRKGARGRGLAEFCDDR